MNRLALLLLVLVTGCGPYTREVTAPQAYSLDGVKLIVKGNEQPQDPTLFGQSSYVVSDERRLLLRFEDLSEHKSGVQVTGGKKVIIRLSLLHVEDVSAALVSLRLCPVTRSWMMLASWSYAHPFGNGGVWHDPGGDYDEAGCMRGTTVTDGDPRTLAFDETQWFIDYPRGRNVNYGFALVSDKALEVVGETSGSFSPRILFDHHSSVTIDPYKPGH